MTEQFTLQEFEKKLPRSKTTGLPLCKSLGIVQGEYCFEMPIEGAVLVIRSSIGMNGVAANTGEDSIRVVMMRDGNPICRKLQNYITRTKGWEDRLIRMCKTFAWIAIKANKVCPNNWTIKRCDGKRIAENKGRFFISKNPLGFVEWIDIEAIKDWVKRNTAY